MSFAEIEVLCGKPDYADSEEWIYSLNTSLFGIFSKKLHFYFLDERVTSYTIHKYTMNARVQTQVEDEKEKSDENVFPKI